VNNYLVFFRLERSGLGVQGSVFNMNSREIKIAVPLLFGMYMFMVCFNNITDYGSNAAFVQKVLTMAEVYSPGNTGWRAINSPLLQGALYKLIIAMECITCYLLLKGSWNMLVNYTSSAEHFNHAKRWPKTGLLLGFILFFGVFLTGAGEWFLMWQSQTYNAQGTAFSLSILFLLALILMDKDDH
jgi:predicted small integral membrane protein